MVPKDKMPILLLAAAPTLKEELVSSAPRAAWPVLIYFRVAATRYLRSRFIKRIGEQLLSHVNVHRGPASNHISGAVPLYGVAAPR